MNWFSFILQLLPTIVSLVQQIETTIPGKNQGTAKLNLVLDTINTAVQAIPEAKAAAVGNDLNGPVTAIINSTVANLNKTGVFTK